MSAASARTASWASYMATIGDRSSLFALVGHAWPVRRVLYPGSYVDLAPSTAFADVTYVDLDARAARFFADGAAIRRDLASHAVPGGDPRVRFLHADYTADLGLAPASFDLLISLYAGPVWDSCRPLLRPGGLLMANTSHGDASIAALDPGLELVGVLTHRGERYRLARDGLDGYLIPKAPERAQADLIRASGRGIAYTRAAFAYVFRLREGDP